MVHRSSIVCGTSDRRLTHARLWQTSPADASMLWLQNVWPLAPRTLRCRRTAPLVGPWGGPFLCLVATGTGTATADKPGKKKKKRTSCSHNSRKTQFIFNRLQCDTLINIWVSHWFPGESVWWQPADASLVPACPGPRGAVHRVV